MKISPNAASGPGDLREERAAGRAWDRAAWVVIAVGIALRWLHLTADPPNWLGGFYIRDEGLWTGFARHVALFGELPRFTESIETFQAAISPLFSLTTYLSILVLGPGFLAHRFFSALFGSLLVVSFHRVVRSKVRAPAALVGTTCVALDPLLVTVARVGVPESAVILCEWVALAVFLSDRPLRRRILLGAACVLAGVAFKVTFVLALPGLGLAALLAGREPATIGAFLRRHAPSRGAWLWIGATGALFVVIGLFTGAFDEGGALRVLAKYAGLSSPRSIANRLAHSNAASSAAILGWPLVMGLLARASSSPESRARTSSFLPSLACTIGMALVFFGSFHSPDRYMLRVLVPLALTASLAIDSLLDVDLRAWREAWSGPGRLGTKTLAVLPVAVVLGNFVEVPIRWILGPWNWPDGLWLLGSAGLAVGLAFLLVRRMPARWGGRLVDLFPFPMLLIGAWWVQRGMHPHLDRYWFANFQPKHVRVWVSTVSLGLVFAPILARAWIRERGVRLVSLAVCCLGLGLLAAQLPYFCKPMYTMLHASRRVATGLSHVPEVVSAQADALFAETKLRYHAITSVDRKSPPSAIVVHGDPERTSKLREDVEWVGYVRVRQLPISLGMPATITFWFDDPKGRLRQRVVVFVHPREFGPRVRELRSRRDRTRRPRSRVPARGEEPG